MNLRLENGIMSDGAWDYLLAHKFGGVSEISILGSRKKTQE